MTPIIPIPPDIAHRPLAVSCSGGKDSVATILALREHNITPDIIVCADTGWESLAWYDWMQRLPGLLGVEIQIVKAVIDGLTPDELAAAEEVEAVLGVGISPMVRLMLQRALFPSRFMRFCTDELKAAPMREYLESIDLDDAIRVTGVRAGESRARAAYPAVEWVGAKSTGQWHWRPIHQYTLTDVLEIHKRYGIPLSPIYGTGVKRLGCWPCLPAKNKAEIRIVSYDRRRSEAIALLQHHVMRLKRLKHGGKTGEWQMFPISPIGSDEPSSTWEQAVEWSRTARGGREADRQQAFWSDREMSLPCRRMGYCDTAEPGDDDDGQPFSC